MSAITILLVAIVALLAGMEAFWMSSSSISRSWHARLSVS